MRGKTAFLNLFRRIFTVPPLDAWMARLTAGRDVNSVIVRMMPPNYLFPDPTSRTVVRAGVKMDLNIHDYMDHALYFDFQDASREALFKSAIGSQIIVDVGANNGFTALRFSGMEGVKHVIAFEPDPANFGRAASNLALNGDVESITLLNLGLGAEDAELGLRVGIEGNSGTMKISSELSSGSSGSKIRVTRLDDTLADQGIHHVDFIKVDVEGYEMEVLKGARKTLETSKPRLFIEIDDANLREQSSSGTDLIHFLRGLGYQCENTVTGETLDDDYPFEGKHFDALCNYRAS
jgi:FkbM family methyltransferase